MVRSELPGSPARSLRGSRGRMRPGFAEAWLGFGNTVRKSRWPPEAHRRGSEQCPRGSSGDRRHAARCRQYCSRISPSFGTSLPTAHRVSTTLSEVGFVRLKVVGDVPQGIARLDRGYRRGFAGYRRPSARDRGGSAGNRRPPTKPPPRLCRMSPRLCRMSPSFGRVSP